MQIECFRQSLVGRRQHLKCDVQYSLDSPCHDRWKPLISPGNLRLYTVKWLARCLSQWTMNKSDRPRSKPVEFDAQLSATVTIGKHTLSPFRAQQGFVCLSHPMASMTRRITSFDTNAEKWTFVHCHTDATSNNAKKRRCLEKEKRSGSTREKRRAILLPCH